MVASRWPGFQARPSATDAVAARATIFAASSGDATGTLASASGDLGAKHARFDLDILARGEPAEARPAFVEELARQQRAVARGAVDGRTDISIASLTQAEPPRLFMQRVRREHRLSLAQLFDGERNGAMRGVLARVLQSRGVIRRCGTRRCCLDQSAARIMTQARLTRRPAPVGNKLAPLRVNLGRARIERGDLLFGRARGFTRRAALGKPRVDLGGADA